MDKTDRQVEVKLDESQVAAACMVAEKMNAMTAEERANPDTMKKMAEEARKLIETIRKRRLALGMTARGQIDNWTAPQREGRPTGSLGLNWRNAIPPSVEELLQKRYLMAVNRIAAGQVADPNFSNEELADIADVLGAGKVINTSMDDFITSRKTQNA